MASSGFDTYRTRIDRMEHRWGRRIACGAPAILSTDSGLTAAGRLRDVSLSGAFVETAIKLPPFSRVAVATQHRKIPAIVVRVAADGVGVEWIETSQRPICRHLGCATPCAAAAES